MKKTDRLDRVVRRNKKYLMLDVVLAALLAGGMSVSVVAVGAELSRLAPSQPATTDTSTTDTRAADEAPECDVRVALK